MRGIPRPTASLPCVKAAGQAFKYDHTTGFITKAADTENNRAERKHNGGYYCVSFRGTTIMAHRMAFALYHQRWPENEIDHIDRDRLNNAIINLREATRTENNRNVGLTARNTSGFKGVTKRAKAKKWEAKIKENGKTKSLGHFDTREEASAAYLMEAQQAHGDFAGASGFSRASGAATAPRKQARASGAAMKEHEHG